VTSTLGITHPRPVDLLPPTLQTIPEAHTGDPNGADLPRWHPFDPAQSVPQVQSLAPGTDGIKPVPRRLSAAGRRR
jgi:hypothetical protein